MKVTHLYYDGTFEGLLTAVFEIYDRKLAVIKIHKGEPVTNGIFDEVLQVYTNEFYATRVLKGLRKKLSPAGVQRLYIAHMGEIPGEENNLVGFMRHVFDSDISIEEDYGNPYVIRLSEVVRMMRREKHRMEAFVRFQKLKDETFYANIEPDFNVLPLLIRHFKCRYADQKWMIYDAKRNYGVYYDLHDTEFITLDFSPRETGSILSAYTEDEGIYQHLWKNYFHSVNIPARKNTRLHMRHIPKRYWKHLTEKI